MEILDGMSEEEKNKFFETTHISYNLPGSEEEGQVVNPMLISNSDVLDLYSTVRNQLQNFSIVQLDVLERSSLKKNTSKPFKSRRSDWMLIPDQLSAAINQAKRRVDHLLESAVKTSKPVYPNQKIIGHHSLQRNLQEAKAAVHAMHTSLLGMQNYPLSRINSMLATDKKKDGDATANPEGADQEGADQEGRSGFILDERPEGPHQGRSDLWLKKTKWFTPLATTAPALSSHSSLIWLILLWSERLFQ